MAIGLAGFTTRNRVFTREQLERTYRKLADLGYDGPEFLLGGRAGLPPEEDIKLVKKYGLKIIDMHGDLDNPDEVKRSAELLGVNICWIKHTPEEMRTSSDGYKAYAERINKWAKIYKPHGIRLQYHNHAQEFRNFPELGGKNGLSILIEETDPEEVFFEIDTHWVVAGGGDPAQWILKVKNRIPVVHYKDYAFDYKSIDVQLSSVAKRFAEIGQGNINWPAVTAACGEAGCKWYVVEQDQTQMVDEFDSLKISIDYMRNTLGIK
jgi:sugar phosphate isomerase/epimerase